LWQGIYYNIKRLFKVLKLWKYYFILNVLLHVIFTWVMLWEISIGPKIPVWSSIYISSDHNRTACFRIYRKEENLVRYMYSVFCEILKMSHQEFLEFILIINGLQCLLTHWRFSGNFASSLKVLEFWLNEGLGYNPFSTCSLK